MTRLNASRATKKRAKGVGSELSAAQLSVFCSTTLSRLSAVSAISSAAQLVPSAPHETFLVIDATTGQNGISQAKSFKEITDVTGIVLTKLDGTAKGGIVLAIKDSVDIPVKFVGLGESKEDLRVFDIEKYIYGLFKDM